MKKYLLCCGFFLFLGIYEGFAQKQADTKKDFDKEYRNRITKEKLNGVYIPKNLKDAFKELDRLTSPEAKKRLLSVPEDVAAKKLHFSFGRWMIHNWSFYEGSRLAFYLQSAGVSHPDDMANFLILAYHRHLRGVDINIRELAVRMRDRRKKIHAQKVESGTVIEEKRRKKN